MFPANHYMDPYHSHYKNHVPYPYYPPPRWEIPPNHPRAMDSSYYPPPRCGTWPYNHDTHHSHPSEFHCCCNRTYPPDYYSFRTPFPHELPPPHLYYHGPFSQHPACPPYFVPSHPYPVDHTPYGYDKLKSHCCGCPNHVCPGAEKSNVKIEEERPDVKLESEHKNADGSGIIQNINNKYPFILLPSGNMKGKENGDHHELSPQILNEWTPVSSKRLQNVKQQEQDNQGQKQFQWPIVWMPAGYDVPKQKAKEMNEAEETPKSPKISEEAPQSPNIKIIPLSWFENGGHDEKPATRNGSGDHNNRSAVKDQPVVTDHRDSMALEGNPKTNPAVHNTINEKKPLRANCKTIPVVPEKASDEKKASTCRTIPVMKENDEKKIGTTEQKEAKEANNSEKVEENRKTKNIDSSIAKHSKLPPVCLRVDPLPRKKSRNGSSRSPSPPTRKDADNGTEDMKEAQSKNMEPKQSGTNKHITASRVKENPSYEVKEETGLSNETVPAASVEHSQEEVPTSRDAQKVQADSTTIGTPENAGTKSIHGGVVQESAGAGSMNGCDESKNEDGAVIASEAAKDDARTYKVNLSEPDAAVRIQSAYRGYGVRRWQPLDKLRKIRHVHEQMQGVKKQLQCLEDSCNKPTQKEQVAIGETIMNLLLELDTIQGLHPSVREARKSVARELICLQEKLDTLCKAPSADLNHANSNEDESQRTENIIQTAAPTVITEAPDRNSQHERAVESGKAEEPSSVEYMEPCNAVPSGVSLEMKPDAASDENNEKHKSCNTIVDEAQEVPSSMDMISDDAFTEFPTDNQEDKIGESNVNSVEQVTEEKPAAESEVKDVPLVNSIVPVHDAASPGDSSGSMTQCTTSSDENLCAESNTGFSPASTEDIDISALTASVESAVATEEDGPVDRQVDETEALGSVELKDDVPAEDQQNKLNSPVVHLEDPGLSPASTEGINISALTASVEGAVATEKDGPVDRQVHETGAIEDVELKDDVSSAEDQQNKSSNPVVHLEDPLVTLKDVKQHGQTTAKDLVSKTEDQQEARDLSFQVQAVDAKQDSGKAPDGTTEASTNDGLDHGSSADVEKHDRPTLLEPTLESISAPELTVLDESGDKMQCGLSGKDELPHVDEKTETFVDELTGSSTDCEGPLIDASRSEPDIQESHSSLGEEVGLDIQDQESHPKPGEEADATRDGVFCDLDSHESSCPHDDGITVYEGPGMKVASERQTDALNENVYSDTRTQRAMEGESSAEDSDLGLSEMDKCDEMLKDARAHPTGVNPAEDEASLKEDISVQTENKGSASVSPDDPMVSSDEKKPLADENQKLIAPAHARGANPAGDEASLKEDMSVQIENKGSASVSPDNPKVSSDEKKLAEENQKLKELLQKLLASGNDQMVVITDLSEKVEALERKLSRKKRPRVRVHRPSRHAMAKAH